MVLDMSVHEYICPICMERDSRDVDLSDTRVNSNHELYYFQCRRCMQRACAICMKKHFKINESCPFCRYTGILEGKSRCCHSIVEWEYRRILSLWDDPEVDSSDGDPEARH